MRNRRPQLRKLGAEPLESRCLLSVSSIGIAEPTPIQGAIGVPYEHGRMVLSSSANPDVGVPPAITLSTDTSFVVDPISGWLPIDFPEAPIILLPDWNFDPPIIILPPPGLFPPDTGINPPIVVDPPPEISPPIDPPIVIEAPPEPSPPDIIKAPADVPPPANPPVVVDLPPEVPPPNNPPKAAAPDWHSTPTPEATDLVSITLVATDPQGNPISSVQAGQPFVLHEYVQDVDADHYRADWQLGGGLFAVANNISFDPSMAYVSGAIHYSPDTFLHKGTVSNHGSIDDLGAANANFLSPMGLGKWEVFSIPLTANKSGSLKFSTTPDTQPGDDTCLYFKNVAVAANQIDFGSLTLPVVGDSPSPPGSPFPDPGNNPPQSPASTDQVKITLTATDPQGNPISSVQTGQPFVLHEYVQDVDANHILMDGRFGAGVYAAYNKLSFDTGLVHVSGATQFSSETYGQAATVSDSGTFDAVGAASLSFSASGLGQWEILSIPMTAANAGPLKFSTAPDNQLGHETLLYGEDLAVPSDRINFGSLELPVLVPSSTAPPTLASKNSPTETVSVATASPLSLTTTSSPVLASAANSIGPAPISLTTANESIGRSEAVSSQLYLQAVDQHYEAVGENGEEVGAAKGRLARTGRSIASGHLQRPGLGLA